MPNWCFNNLCVTGDNKASLTAFRQWLGDDGFLLNKIAPLPVELENTTSPTPKDQIDAAKILQEKYGVPDWYSWRVNNWGTKWDVEATVDDDDESNINITFDSAWSPPCMAIAALGTLFPDLSFTLTYHEPGMCFAGTLTVYGSDVEDNCIDGSKNKEGYQQFCIDEFNCDPFEDE